MTDTGEHGIPRWTRRWLTWVAVLAALGLAAPWLIGEGDKDHVPKPQDTTATTTPAAATQLPPWLPPPPVPLAPWDAQGCPQWIDTGDIGRDVGLPPPQTRQLVVGTPDSAIACRYLVEDPFGTHSRQANLDTSRPLPDPQTFTTNLNRGTPFPTQKSVAVACELRTPTYHYLILFAGEGRPRQPVHLDPCGTATNGHALFRLDAEAAASVEALFAA